MPSKTNFYEPQNLKNGELFQDSHIAYIEQGIVKSFNTMLPQMGNLDINVDLTKGTLADILAPGIYNLYAAENNGLPYSNLYGNLIVFDGNAGAQMIIANDSAEESTTVKAYFRRRYANTDEYSDWVTFDIEGAAAQALIQAKQYTDQEVKTVKETTILDTIEKAQITIDQLIAGTTNKTIPSNLLPSYVDDVIEFSNKASFPTKGESGKIYVAQDSNKTYRWSGSTYTEISASLALGETNSTAYPGNLGALAYEHAVTNKGISVVNGLYKITANSEGHITEATTVSKQDITNLGIPAQDTTYKIVDTSKAGLVPKIADSTKIIGQNDLILADQSGTLAWYKLPTTAYNDINVSAELTEGIKIGTIIINGKTVTFYIPEINEESGSSVSVTPVITSGTKIATIVVDGQSQDLYIPSTINVEEISSASIDNICTL